MTHKVAVGADVELNQSGWRRLSFMLLAVTTAATVGVIVLRPIVHVIASEGAADLLPEYDPAQFAGVSPFELIGLPFAVAAHLILRRVPNRVGLVLHGIGLAFVFSALGIYFDVFNRLRWRLGVVGDLVSAWVGYFWLPAVVLLFVFLPLLFPTGHAPSPRWRWVAWGGAGVLIVGLVSITQQTVVGTEPLTGPLWRGLVALLVVSVVGALTSVVFRYRRADITERQQVKWVTFTMVVGGAIISLSLLWGKPLALPLLLLIVALTFVSIPVSIAMAIARYRLYDIDLVISRTFVYGLLALFISAVYIAIVVGAGTLIGSGGQPNTALSIAATAVIAIAFQPVRRWLQRIANRLVYGRKATPYQVLSDFSRRLAATDEKVIEQLARSLADGTSAHSAAVWIRSGNQLLRSTVWPPDASDPESVPIDSERIPGADRTAWVTHDGERLGALTLVLPRGQQPTPIDERLLSELASGMGLALRNSVLTQKLHLRVEELRESRRRIVAVQDETRRKLERDLHDGAQQQLVALKVKLSLARRLAASSGAFKTSEVLEGLNVEADGAIQAMREFARGIYPPLLEAEGLAAALIAQTRKSALLVSVEAADLTRYPQQIESTVYFCVVEALQNSARHARAQSAHVRVWQEGDHLRFSVNDDGTGFDPATTGRGSGLTNLADRIDALGGQLQIESSKTAGTTVTASIPLTAMVPA